MAARRGLCGLLQDPLADHFLCGPILVDEILECGTNRGRDHLRYFRRDGHRRRNCSGFQDIRNENTEGWGLLYWGDHRILRLIAAGSASVAAGLIAGAIGRTRGALLGSAATVPAVGFWAFGFWLSIGQAPVADRLLALALPVVLPVVGAWAGTRGAAEVQPIRAQFDARPRTLLGVYWYHYLWIWPVSNLLCIQATWVLLYGTQWAATVSIVVPNVLLLFAMLWTVTLTAGGLAYSYRVLAGLQPSSTPGRDVLKGAVGFPLLALVLQGVFVAIHQTLERQFS